MKELGHTRYSLLLIVGVLALLSTVFFGYSPALARVGVGMGAGEIRLTDAVKPGGIYSLPSLRIFNTGDVVTTYGMGVAYHAEHKELRPQKDWFKFDPSTFTLDPEKSQEVSIRIFIPLKAEPGEYFSFIESGPIPTNEPGTSVGVAVGTKLFFTIVPANLWQGLVYRSSTFLSTYSPWSWIGLGVVLFIIFIAVIRRFFSFNIGVKSR